MGLRRHSGYRNGCQVGVEPQLSLCTIRSTSSASPLSSSLSSRPSCSLSDSPSPSSSPLVSPSTPKTVAPRRGLAAWLVDQVDSGNFPGLVWDDLSHSMFRIPWKHAGKQNYNQGDGAIFKAWAVYRGRFREGAEQADPPAWKTRLRCALNKSPELHEVTSRSQMDISHPYKVYHIVASQNVLHGHKLGVFSTQNVKPHLVSSPQQHLVSPAVPIVLPPSLDSPSAPPTSIRLPVRIPAVESISAISTPAESDTAGSNPVALSSLLRDHELPPNIIADLCKQRHWLDVTVAYRGRTLLLQRVYALQGFRLVPPGSATILASNDPKLIPLPSVHNLTTPRLRESAETLVRFVTGGVSVWLENAGARDSLPAIWAQRCCRAQVFFAGGMGLPGQDGQATKLQRGVKTTIFDPHVFQQRLQQFANGWGPAPTSEAVLCLGEAFTPGDGRRRLITIHVKPVYAELLLNEISNHVTDETKHSQSWPIPLSPIAAGAPSPPDTPPHPMDIGKCPPIPLSMNDPSKLSIPMPSLDSQDCRTLIGSEFPSSSTSEMVRCSNDNGIQFGVVPTLSVITFAPAPSLPATPRSASSVPRSSPPSPPHSPPFSSTHLVRKQPPFGTQLLVLKAKPMTFTLAHQVFLSTASRIPTSKVLRSTDSEAGELPVSLLNLLSRTSTKFIDSLANRLPSSPADSSPMSLDNHVTQVANHPALTQAIRISVTDNHLVCPSSQVSVTSICHLPSPSTKELLFPPTQKVSPPASKPFTPPPPPIKMSNSNLRLATSAASFFLRNPPPIFSTAPSDPPPPNGIPPMPSLIVSVIPCLSNVPRACSTNQEASSPSKPNPPETG
uniref:uncharacterized protein isoform X1 n=2 Tax=Myxine glutinosa TaxID=7769 RepID=UPI00358EA0CF